MATVTLNASVSSGSAPLGFGANTSTGIAAAQAGNSPTTVSAFRTTGTFANLYTVTANPQIILTGVGNVAGDYLCQSSGLTGLGQFADASIEWAGFTWQQTFNTSTGALSPPLAVVSATSTVLTVGASPATAGFSSAGIIQVFHNSGTTPQIALYSYTGVSGSTFTGCALISLSIVASGTDVPSSAIALTSLSAGDKVVQFWRPPTNAVITRAYFQMQIGIENFIGMSNAFDPDDGSLVATFPRNSIEPTVSTSTSLLAALNGGGSPPILGSGTPGNYLTAATTPAALVGWIYQTASTNVTPLTDIDFGAWANVIFGMGEIESVTQGIADERIGSISLVVTYALPPSSTITLPAIISGTIYSTSVKVNWAFSDPQGSTQSTFRVVAFNTADCSAAGFSINDPSNYAPVDAGVMGGGQTWGTAGVSPVYDSGDVMSTAKTFTIPPGSFLAGSQYRVFVFVTDGAAGSTGSPYQIMTNSGTVTGNTAAINAGADFFIGSEPTLMPALSFPSTPSSPSLSFNPVTGEIGPISVRARQNLLTAVDADQGISSPSGLSVGGWTMSVAALNSGTGTNPSIAAAASTAYAGGILKVTPYGTTTAIVTMASGLATCVPGEMLTATCKVFNTSAANPTTCRIGMYFDSAPGVFVEAVIPNTNKAVPTPSTTAQSNPGLMFAQCKVPDGAVLVALIVQFSATLSSNPGAIWEIWQPMITNNCINLLDDAPFAAGQIGNTAAGTQPLKAPVGAGWQAEPKGTNPAATMVVDTRPDSYLGGTGAADLVVSDTANTSSIHTAYLILNFTADTSSFLYAVDLVNQTSNLAPTIGGVTTAGAAQAGTTTSPAVTTTGYTRFTGTLTPNFAGSFGYFGVVVPTGTAGDLRMTNAQLERVWTLTDGTMEKFTAPQTVPLSAALGDNGAATGTIGSFQSYGHWWQLIGKKPSGTNAVTSTTAPFSGTNCMILTTSTTTVAPIGIEQFFTVSGWSSFTAAWEWKLAGVQGECYIEFFDSANTLLSAQQQSTPGQVISQIGVIATGASVQGFGFGQFGSGTFGSPGGSGSYSSGSLTVTVPANAAYAHIVFTAQSQAIGSNGALSIDAVTVTGTGTLTASTPWLDGGWSQGGLNPNVNSLPTVTLERSLLNIESGWVFLRSGAGSAGPVTVSGQEGAVFEDFEFPSDTSGTAKTLYYRANAQFSNGLPSPYQIIALTNADAFATSQWTLTDVLLGEQATLQVVGKVDITTAENQTILMPMGRGRKVVLGDSLIFGDTITLPLQTLTNADFVALQALYSLTRPLVLRSPDGEWWWVRATTRSRTRTWQGSYVRPLRTYTLVFEQVDPIS